MLNNAQVKTEQKDATINSDRIPTTTSTPVPFDIPAVGVQWPSHQSGLSHPTALSDQPSISLSSNASYGKFA